MKGPSVRDALSPTISEASRAARGCFVNGGQKKVDILALGFVFFTVIVVDKDLT